MKPGHINGVRVIWPEFRAPTVPSPAPPPPPVPDVVQGAEAKPCKRGHREGRYRSGACIRCAKDTAREWYRAKANGARA